MSRRDSGERGEDLGETLRQAQGERKEKKIRARQAAPLQPMWVWLDNSAIGFTAVLDAIDDYFLGTIINAVQDANVSHSHAIAVFLV